MDECWDWDMHGILTCRRTSDGSVVAGRLADA
jgi:hypothetical protein